MENKSNLCYRCKNFERFYIKGNVRFNKTELGRCCVKREIVNYFGGCENYKHRLKNISRFAARERIDKLLCEITELRCLIEDDSRDESEQ